MKKYLLTALLWVFGLFGFASATDITFTSATTEWESFPYTPSSFTITENVSFDYFDVRNSVECDETVAGCCVISFRSEQDTDSDEICYIESDSTESSCSLTPWTYYVSLNSSDCIGYTSITLPVWESSSSGWWDSDSSPLLSGWTTVFSGIISSLGSAVSEFIPYVAYIWIGLLGAIIWFVAIKRLINRIRAKIFWTFNSRRRK